MGFVVYLVGFVDYGNFVFVFDYMGDFNGFF